MIELVAMNEAKSSDESETFPSESSKSIPDINDILEHTQIHTKGGKNTFKGLFNEPNMRSKVDPMKDCCKSKLPKRNMRDKANSLMKNKNLTTEWQTSIDKQV